MTVKNIAVLSILCVIGSLAAAEVQPVRNTSFSMQNGNVDAWQTAGKWLVDLEPVTGGMAVTVKKAPEQFNHISFTQDDVPLTAGVWRLKITASGDAGTGVFIGMRIKGKSGNEGVLGGDIWKKLDGDTVIEKSYTVKEDMSVMCIIALGMKENDGKKILLRDFSMSRAGDLPEAAATKPAGAIGPGAEYDGIVVLRESEVGGSTTLNTVVAVDEKKIIRQCSPNLLGYNHDGGCSEATFMKNGVLDEDLIARLRAKGIPMPLNRIQGFGYYEMAHWKYCLGPMEKRTPMKFISWDKLKTMACGPVESVQFCLRVDPNAKFTWVVDVENETPDDSADLVEFLTGDGSNPRGETNWAKMRIDLGLPDPVPVLIWEMDNELDWKSKEKRMPVQEYIDRCRRHIAAMRAVNPKVKIALFSATAPWASKQRFNEDWRDWHRAILKQLGSDIDFISTHFYYSGNPISYIEGSFQNVIRDDIRAITGENRVKTYASEHATWPGDIAKKETWYSVNTLSAALSVAHYVSRMLVSEEIAAATFHCFVHGGGLWGLLDRGKTTKELFTTVYADLFPLLNRALGENVVAADVSGERIGDGKGEKTLFVATPMTTKDGLNLLLVNREVSAKRQVSFTFNNSYSLIKETVLTAPSPRSHNTEFITNSFVAEYNTMVDNFISYLMPSKSAVVLTLKRR